MFYEVRVLDSKNKLKKIVSGQQLSRKYWDKFESNFSMSSAKIKKRKRNLPQKTISSLFMQNISGSERC